MKYYGIDLYKSLIFHGMENEKASLATVAIFHDICYDESYVNER